MVVVISHSTDDELEQEISAELDRLGTREGHRDVTHAAPLQALNAEKLARALNNHTLALVRAAEASDRHASQLV